VHSKKKGVLVWKNSRIKNSCIARYVCDMRRMSRAMYNILCVACYIRLEFFHKKTFFSRLRLMHTEAQAQELVNTTSTLLYYQGYSLLAHHHRFSMYLEFAHLPKIAENGSL